MCKKRPVLLLELLIALTLVTLLSVYLIRNPMYQLQKEIDALVDLEADRLWLLKLMEWRTTPPEPWDKFVEKETEASWKEVALKTNFGEIQKNKVERYYYWRVDRKESPDQTQNYRVRFKLKRGTVQSQYPAYDFFVAVSKK